MWNWKLGNTSSLKNARKLRRGCSEYICFHTWILKLLDQCWRNGFWCRLEPGLLAVFSTAKHSWRLRFALSTRNHGRCIGEFSVEYMLKLTARKPRSYGEAKQHGKVIESEHIQIISHYSSASSSSCSFIRATPPSSITRERWII